MIVETNHVKKMGDYDVLVAGGGIAGVAAALSSARSGCKTLLIEKSMLLGGLATLGLVNYIEPLCDGRGRKIIGGMCEELLRLSIAYGYDTLPEPWQKAASGEATDINFEVPMKDPDRPPRYTTRFSPHIFAMCLTGLLTDHGVTILFDTQACRPVMENRICLGVIVENKTGRGFYGAKITVDTTGDSDLLYRAGVPVQTAGNWFTYQGRVMDMETLDGALKSGQINRAVRPFTIGSDLYGKGHPEGVKKFDGTNTEDISAYVILAHKLAMDKICHDERFQRDVVMLPGMPQFRTTRRIRGEYELAEQDQAVHFEDSIGAINDFTKRDILYEVPYRCLYNRQFPNMITAGRTISSCGWAWDVTRVIPPAILTGQASGLAAAMAAKEGKYLSDISVETLQESLADTGVLIHF